MPEGPFKADHPLTTPPPRAHVATYRNPHHPLPASVVGTVMPANESSQTIEATKGITVYYLTSDPSTMSYRPVSVRRVMRICSNFLRRRSAQPGV
ncbi:hypothetical protein ACNKHN_13415 [Shigella flexneri]